MKRMASYIAKLAISEKREKVLIRYKGSVKNRSKLPGERVAVKPRTLPPLPVPEMCRPSDR